MSAPIIARECVAGWYHDFRTAVGLVLAYADLQATRKCTHEQALDGIRSSCSYLLEMIDGLYDTVAVDDTDHDFVPFDEMLADVLDTFRTTADLKGIATLLTFEPDLPRVHRSRVVTVKRVLANLLSNAIRCSERGQLSIHAGRAIDAALIDEPVLHEATPSFYIEVADQGCGMNRQQLQRLLELQVANQPRRGRGQGVRTTAQLAESLGGRVSISSQLGVGTRARVTLPATALAAGGSVAMLVEKRNASPELKVVSRTINQNRAIRALLVDDDDDARFCIGALLEALGVDVVGSATVPAVAMVFAGEFDVIVIDEHIGDDSGTALAARLRLAGYRGALVGLSGDAREMNCLGVDEAKIFDTVIDKAEGVRPIEELLTQFSEQLKSSGMMSVAEQLCAN